MLRNCDVVEVASHCHTPPPPSQLTTKLILWFSHTFKNESGKEKSKEKKVICVGISLPGSVCSCIRLSGRLGLVLRLWAPMSLWQLRFYASVSLSKMDLVITTAAARSTWS